MQHGSALAACQCQCQCQCHGKRANRSVSVLASKGLPSLSPLRLQRKHPFTHSSSTGCRTETYVHGKHTQADEPLEASFNWREDTGFDGHCRSGGSPNPWDCEFGALRPVFPVLPKELGLASLNCYDGNEASDRPAKPAGSPNDQTTPRKASPAASRGVHVCKDLLAGLP